ncbi:MAG: hypothetical protein ACM3RP_00985 [Chitinophagales bacterium]
MTGADLVLGLPLKEAAERLSAAGMTFSVRTTGVVGRPAMDRRCERDRLVREESRVVQVRERDQGLELVVAPAFRRSSDEA